MKRRAMAMSCRMEPSAERSPLSGSSGLTRRGKAAIATQVRSAAWMRKLPSTPTPTMSRPARKGPTMRVLVRAAEFREMALSSAARGTTAGMRACRTTWMMVLSTPLTMANT